MKASDVRFALFSLLVLVAVAGPAPIRLPGPKVPRGVGCGGGSKPVVPKFEPPKFKPPPSLGEFRPRPIVEPIVEPPVRPTPPVSRPSVPPVRPSPPIIVVGRPSSPRVGGHVSEAVDAVDAVAPRLEQTASARALEAVPAEVAKKDVAGLQNAARKALEQPNLPAEVKKPLQALLKETEEMVPLQRLLKSLESGDAHALGTLSKEALPGDLRHQLDVAESLEELARILDNPKAAQAPWEAAGKPLGRLTGQARGPEVEEVRVGLALRECGEGHPDLATKLLPRGYRVDEGKVVRDLKMLSPGPKAGTESVEPARLSGIPIPEMPRGTRTYQIERASDGLPVLSHEIEKASPAELSSVVGKASRSARTRMKATVGERLDTSWNSMNSHLSPLALHSSRLLDQARREREDDRNDRLDPATLADVEKHLGRQLSRAEQMMVPDMQRQGKTPSQIAEILKKL